MNLLSYLRFPSHLLQLVGLGVMAVLLALSGEHALALISQVKLYPIPTEVMSSHFRVAMNGRHTDVMHAATSYYLLNFDTNGPVTISVTAEDPHFWDRGVEVQPMRLGIRPRRNGATITFQIKGPEKLTIARPGDHFADADILFLFANPIDYSAITSQTPGVRYYGPGVYRESIDAHSGDTIYLDGGAVIFGSLNIWQVENVRVLGRGTIIYDGPQNPYTDEGWMHKPDWHVIVMDKAKNIEIDGITCITRSRSWQIQMRDSHHIGYYNIKAIGGNPNDANQDGMDWLGGGDTTVRNSFFRASDDVFAEQGNWDGYELAKMRVPGHDVTNITIEDTIASTSISNTIRVAWPQKTFNSAHFHMSDVDVIHTGFGGCKVPFAFFELWADPEGHGSHSNYTFRDIRLDEWYSLFQIRQPSPQVQDISFADIWAMDGPGMVPSVAKGEVSAVKLRGVSLQGIEGAAVQVEDGAAEPKIYSAEVSANFSYSEGLLRPRQVVTFTAQEDAIEGRRFEWLFGDGSRSVGRQVRHTFPDAMGTLLDGSGRFRVLLHLQDSNGNQSWSSQSIVVSQHLLAPYQKPKVERIRQTKEGLRVEDRMIRIPTDGGYTFTLLTSTQGSLQIDDLASVGTPTARRQVCGSVGDSVQPVRKSVALKHGMHRIHIERDAAIENAEPSFGESIGAAVLLWEGPGISRQAAPF
jgi:hypothetical protein